MQNIGVSRLAQQAALSGYNTAQPVPGELPMNTRNPDQQPTRQNYPPAYDARAQQTIQYAPRAPAGPPPSSMTMAQLNPFDLLGIPRATTDEAVVAEAYRKWVNSLHPDRGGDANRFRQVTEAYKMVMQIIQHTKQESFEELKRQAEREIHSYTGAGVHGASAGPSGGGRGYVDQSLAPLGKFFFWLSFLLVSAAN
jgi:hypothetical protein